MRWRLKLEEYEYEIVYKKGKNNTNVDALSRILYIDTFESSPPGEYDDNGTWTIQQRHPRKIPTNVIQRYQDSQKREAKIYISVSIKINNFG